MSFIKNGKASVSQLDKVMNSYVAFLRGVNVGGKSLIKMAELRDALAENKALANVRTYIQSGNVLFESNVSDTSKLTATVAAVVKGKFGLTVGVVVFSRDEWRKVINFAPKWWGADTEHRHNLFIMIPPGDAKDVMTAVGELKPEVETVEANGRVVYHSLSFQMLGRTSIRKLMAAPIYKQLTIRNYNTSAKMLQLLES